MKILGTIGQFGQNRKMLTNSQGSHQMINYCKFHSYSSIFEWCIEFGDILDILLCWLCKWHFSGIWGLMQMLLLNLYLDNMRYQANPMTRTRDKWTGSWQPACFNLILGLNWPETMSRCIFQDLLSIQKL